jgi:hypothetical protein
MFAFDIINHFHTIENSHYNFKLERQISATKVSSIHSEIQ